MNVRYVVVAAAILAFPGLAIAGSQIVVPEPETLALLGVGAIALVVARWRRRR